VLTALLDVFADELTSYVQAHYDEFSYLLPYWMRPFASPSTIRSALEVAKQQARNLPVPVKIAIWRRVAKVLNVAAETYAADFIRGRKDNSLVELLREEGLIVE